MSRRVLATIIMILAFAVLSSDAQQPDGRRGRRGGRFGFGRFFNSNSIVQLAEIPDVQRELQLNDDQRQLIYYLLSDHRDQVNRIVQSVSTRMSPIRSNEDASRELRDEVRDQVGEINTKVEQIVSTVLEPAQRKRLNQIQLQQEGVAALDRKEFAQQLSLSDAQLEKIQRLRQVSSRSSSPDRRGRQVPEEILAVLSEKQQKLWEELKGPAFRFSERPGRSGRSGQRGRPEFESR